MYGLAVVVVSFYLRKWVGQRSWRLIHFESSVSSWRLWLHGIQAGTDTSNPIVLGFYAGVTIAVFGLVAHRLVPFEHRLRPQDGG